MLATLLSSSVGAITTSVVRDEMFHAMLTESEAYYEIEGYPRGNATIFDNLAGVYRTKDNNYVRIHTNFPQ